MFVPVLNYNANFGSTRGNHFIQVTVLFTSFTDMASDDIQKQNGSVDLHGK